MSRTCPDQSMEHALPSYDTDSTLTSLSSEGSKEEATKLSPVNCVELSTVYITGFQPDTTQDNLLTSVKQYGIVLVSTRIIKHKYILVQMGSPPDAQRVIDYLGNLSNKLKCSWGKKNIVDCPDNVTENNRCDVFVLLSELYRIFSFLIFQIYFVLFCENI
ncbi:hypothetical protein PPACK8108_LOCUS23542 [Phakopsora pachyrhizi]|uniref:RRM domain-containing protein n=1 Tax=Phakopsora pachyrhizi TaxID=170000 RepID=A0AAV0BMN2_PHAPC|nr:hypothetical protein PPACK8108_LOCUS23542 [Phakopsora pachyrhizi]